MPSIERDRIFGETNLRTFADGTRVLRTLAAERRRASRKHTAPTTAQHARALVELPTIPRPRLAV